MAIALPHDLVARVRVFGSPNVSTKAGYETDCVTESSGLGDPFFLA